MLTNEIENNRRKSAREVKVESVNYIEKIDSERKKW